MSGPIRVVAEYAHGPFEFDRFPDDVDTLSRHGSLTTGSTDMVATAGTAGVLLTVDLLGHHVEIELSHLAAAELRYQLGELLTQVKP
jgi:hypothetical protein